MKGTKCPVCGSEMKQRNVAKTEIDYCEEHGIWLDKGELSKIIGEVNGSGNSSKLKSAQHDGRIEGIFLGWWSLLLK